MTHILNLAEAALYVDDLSRALDFYQQALGLPVTAQFDDACFLQTGPDSTIILFDRQKLKQRQSIIPGHGCEGRGHIALAIPPDEVDAWRRRLNQHNIEVEHEHDWPQGTHSIYFRDPDQNSLELIVSTHYPRIWESLSS